MNKSKPILEGHEKPRKLEDDTAIYLGQMDVEFDKLPVDDIEGRSILVENVIREVENRLASASCDRRTNFIVEKLVTDGSLEVLIDCMKKCKEYVVFLARNRFASHIVQSMLARMTYLLKDQPNAESENPSLVETVIAFCAPLLHDMHWLSQEQCSSHVLRSVVCLLAGVPPVAEKKTKKAKHQHSVTYSLTLEELVVAGTFPIAHRFSITVPSQFKDSLLSYCEQFYEKKSTHDLQLLVANVSSNAYLLLLLRVLSCAERFDEAQGFKLAQNIVLKVMELSDPSEYGVESSIASSTFFGMAGDRSGSYFLEAVTAFLEKNLFLGLIRGNCLTSLEAFLQDTTSNFVLQAIIRRLDYELGQIVLTQTPKVRDDEDDERSSKKRKKESKKAASATADPFRAYLLQTTVDIFDELLQGVVQAEDMLVKKRTWQERGGVLLSLLQCALTLGKIDTKDDRSHQLFAEKIARLVLFTWTSSSYSSDILQGELDDKEMAVDIARYLSQRITAPPPVAASVEAKEGEPATKAAGCAPTAAPKGYVDMSSQVLLCRLLGALITFPQLKIALIAANIVLAFDVPALKLISTTGNMSRSVFDTYLQFYAPSTSSSSTDNLESSVINVGEVPSFAQQAQMTKQLSATLVAIAPELAGHFVGQHIVKRIFDLSDIRGKERWVQVLSAPSVMMGLQRTKEGRNSLQLVQAEAYARDAGEWRNMMKKQMKASELFKDLLGGSSTNNATAIASGEKAAASEAAAPLVSKKGKKDAIKTLSAMNVDEVPEERQDDEQEDDNGDDDGEDGDGVQNTQSGAGGKRKRKRKRPNQNKNKTA